MAGGGKLRITTEVANQWNLNTFFKCSDSLYVVATEITFLRLLKTPPQFLSPIGKHLILAGVQMCQQKRVGGNVFVALIKWEEVTFVGF